MKKLILAILLLPLSLMAANTNVFDRVLIRNDFQFTGGTIGLNKVLTSDAAGFYTPQSIVSLNATFLTNISSGTLTVTGQGTHTINLESILVNANTITNITSSTLTVTGQGTKVFTLNNNGNFSSVTNLSFSGGSTITNYFIGSSSLGFTTTTLNFGQVQTNTFTITGTAAGDKVIPGWPLDLPNDSVFRMNATAANTISVYRIALINPVVTYTATFSAGVVKDK